MASVIHEFVTSGLDYNNRTHFEAQFGSCTPAPAGWKWGTTAFSMAHVASSISSLCSSLPHCSQTASDAYSRPWSYFSKQLLSQDRTTSKTEFSSMNPHGNSAPLRGLKAQNKASRKAVKKTGLLYQLLWNIFLVEMRQIQILIHFM